MDISPEALVPDGQILADASQARNERTVKKAAKVAFDVLAAALALVLLAPLFIVIAAFVSSDGGPVLYRHRRIGRNGREFKCLKFRTMVVDSDQVLARLLTSDIQAAREWAVNQKLRRDPRITTIGRFLRETSMDELPQLLNVIRLDMSLVGPRPIVEQELFRYGPHVQTYYHARPGITGLWQVSGRSQTTYSRRVELDTWYVRNWSLWLDIKILVKTVPAVLLQRGAA